MFDIKEQLKKLPDTPGVYMHKDAFGQVIYVGKAISLKNRVRQYFQSPKNQPPKVRKMVEHIAEFEYITTGTEMEALILECNLIKKYEPKYNVLLRDDKTYPYIKVTLRDEYPRVLKTRRIVSDGAKYFGPYADVGAVNAIIELLNNVYCLKRCSTSKFPKGFSPCLNYHIHRCKGICQGNVDPRDYAKAIDKAIDFLLGRDKELLQLLNARMNEAAQILDFEAAAEYRDAIEAVNTITEKQRVVLSHGDDLDIVLLSQGLSGAHAVLFTVREGKLSGRESFFLGDLHPGKRAELVAEFIKQYYYANVLIPKEILVEELPEDAGLLEEWLSKQRGGRVSLAAPARGERKALLTLVQKDVVEMVKDLDDKAKRQLEKERAVALGLSDVFGQELSERIHRVEAYDISNINGIDSVGAMVVFYDGRPLKKAYRRFKIKTIDGADDVGSLQEVLYRRMKHAIEKTAGFEELPDLILMDGGQNQVNAALSVLNALKQNVPVAGMAKDDKHRTRALVYNGTETALKGHPELFSYIGAIQEEVHRFAIEYHKKLRWKTLSRSVLDGVPGIGEKRKLALLTHFGSVDAIKAATKDELARAPGMNAAVAESVAQYFAKGGVHRVTDLNK